MEGLMPERKHIKNYHSFSPIVYPTVNNNRDSLPVKNTTAHRSALLLRITSTTIKPRIHVMLYMMG